MMYTYLVYPPLRVAYHVPNAYGSSISFVWFEKLADSRTGTLGRT